LRSAIPEVTTTLRYSYYEIVSPPKSKIALPFLISSETHPADVEALDLSDGSSIENCNEVSMLMYTYFMVVFYHKCNKNDNLQIYLSTVFSRYFAYLLRLYLSSVVTFLTTTRETLCSELKKTIA